MESAIRERDLPWQPKLKSAYLGFYRPGPYYCCGITVKKQQPAEFWVKLPLPPEELRARGDDVPDLYPELRRRWDANNKATELGGSYGRGNTGHRAGHRADESPSTRQRPDADSAGLRRTLARCPMTSPLRL
jgi:hypothetical protein